MLAGLAIRKNSPKEDYSTFNCKPVGQKMATKNINKLNPKKATDVDNLPSKILKVAAETASAPVSNTFDKSIKMDSSQMTLRMLRSPHCLKKMILLSKKYIDLSVF